MEFVKTRKKYKINYYELNTNSQLKESILILFLQDAATVNAEANGFGYSWTEANNLGWFLLKYRIELTEYPKNIDYIEIETESRGASKLFAYRDFVIYNPTNEIIGRVSSCWALIDMETKSMVYPNKIKNDFQVFEKRENDLKFNKIIIPSEFNYQKSYEVRYDDLDVNHHANNSNYIVWALETLPYEFRLKHSIKNVDIQLKKDISLGEIVLAKANLNISDKQSIHVLMNKISQEDLGFICINWD